MPKQLNINLSMTADTSKAKAQLQQLQQQLTNLTKLNTDKNSFGITKELQEASTAAAQLKVQLQAATDVNTGKLDLTRFNQQLKQSGMSISQYQQSLRQLGAEGDQAFSTLAMSIVNADAKAIKLSSRLEGVLTSLKNTARWQLSSAALHTFMGQIQSAYGYAKDLNSSLNSIRIVTGQTSDQMAEFATRANAAAKSLSASTTAYTDAALIFYQQGLRDTKDIENRTNAVIKMANVTGDAVTEVSSYMTAIWNNFDDGSKSLENYADIITALGASTASSSAEIAAGLEKYASVAKTIGLSYEYSTSALATIIANTRQSADTVGTGLRTIFSRLEGLSLGDTLDDGVDLNKYSKALATAGVNILDTSGKLKDMDTILDNLAEKWGTLSRAQQAALAQTVGGVRQYTTLIALMDNWDDMQQNLLTANNAEGSLQEQADIYAESWEASSKRVQASLQQLYKMLIDDKFFIGLNNSIQSVVDKVANLIKNFGGLKSILLSVGSLITTIFHKQLSSSLSGLGTSLKLLIPGQKEKMQQQMKEEATTALSNMAVDDGTLSGSATGFAYENQAELMQELEQHSDNMSAVQKQIAQSLIDQNHALSNTVIEESKLLKQKEQEANAQRRIMELRRPSFQDQSNRVTNINTMSKQLGAVESADSKMLNAKTQQQDLNQLKAVMTEIQEGYIKIGMTAKEALGTEAGAAFEQLYQDVQQASNLDDIEISWQQWTEALVTDTSKVEDEITQLTMDMLNLQQESSDNPWTDQQRQDFERLRNELNETSNAFREVGQQEEQVAASSGKVAQSTDHVKKSIKELNVKTTTLSDVMTTAVSSITSVMLVLNLLSSAVEIFNDDTKTLNQKIIAILPLVAMMGTSILGIVKSLQAATGVMTIFGTTINLTMWHVTAIVAAIGALVQIVVQCVDQMNQPTALEKELKKTTEAAKEAKNALNETSEVAQNLLADFDAYEEIKSTFDACTKGTTKWKEQMEQLNQKTKDLIDKYPQLKDFPLQINSDGSITFKQEDIQQQKKQAENQEAAAWVTSTNANQENQKNIQQKGLADLHLEKNITEIFANNKELQGLTDTYYPDFQVLDPDLISKALINTSYTDPMLLNDYDKGINGLISNYLKLYEQQYGFIPSTDNDDWTAWFKTLLPKNSNSLQSLQDFIENNDKLSTNLQNDIMSFITNGAIFQDDGQFGDLDLVSKKLIAEDLLKTNNINLQPYKDSNNGSKNFDNYKKQFNIDGTFKKIKNNEYQYTDAEGNVQSIPIAQLQHNLETYNTLTNSEYLERIKNSAINKSTQYQSNGLESYVLNGNLSNLTEKQFNDLQQKVRTNRSFIGLTPEQHEALPQAIEEYKSKINDYLNSIPKDIRETIDKFSSSEDLSQESKQKIGDLFKKVYIDGGEEAFKELEGILSNLSDEQLIPIINTLSTVDLSTISLDDLNDILLDLNVPVKSLDINFTGLLQNIQKTHQQLPGIQEDFASLTKIIGKLKTGDTISAKDYEALESVFGVKGKEVLNQFFATMEDGTHQLVVDAEEFYNTAIHRSQENNLENIKTIQGVSDYQTSQKNKQSLVNILNSGSFNGQGTAQVAQAYLNSLNLTDDDEKYNLSLVNNSLAKGESLSTDLFFKLQDLMINHQMTTSDLEQTIRDLDVAIKDNSEAFLSTASSLEDLDGLTQQLSAVAGSDTAISGYRKSLVALGSTFDECEQQVKDYQTALQGSNDEDKEKTELALRASIVTATLAKKYNLSSDSIKTQAQLLKDSKKYEELNSEALIRMATANQRMNRGVAALNKDFTGWKKTLQESETTSQDYADTINSIRDAVADLTGVLDPSKISSSFITENIGDIEAAADGSEQAINRLGITFAKESVKQLGVNQQFKDAFKEAVKGGDDFDADTVFTPIRENIEKLIGIIEDGINGSLTNDQIQSNIEAFGEDWIDNLNKMAIATGMSVDEMNALLSQMGVQANLDVVSQLVPMKAPIYQEHKKLIEYKPGPPEEYTTETFTDVVGEENVNGLVSVAQISAGDKSLKPKITYTGLSAPGVSTSATSTSKSKKITPKDKVKADSSQLKKNDDEIDRYHEIKQSLETIGNDLDLIAQKKDRAFGRAKLKLMVDENNALAKKISLQKSYIAEINDYLKKDKAAAQAQGIKMDKDGNISNYEEIMAQKIAQYNAAYNQYIQQQNQAVANYNDKKDANLDDDQKEQLDKEFKEQNEHAEEVWKFAQEEYETFKKILSQYEETLHLSETAKKELDSQLAEHLSNRLKEVEYVVDLKIQVDDKEIAIIQEYLNNIGDSADTARDAITNLGKQLDQNISKSKTYQQGLEGILMKFSGISDDLRKKIMKDKDSGYEDYKLTTDDMNEIYQAGLTDQSISDIEAYTSALLEENNQLRSLRDDAISKVSAAFSEYTDNLDRNSSKIEHLQKVTNTYKNVIDIVGKKILDNSGELTAALDQANFDMQRNNTHALKSELEFIDDAIKKQEELIAQQGNDVIKRQLQDQLKEMQDKRDSTYESWLDSWEAECQAAADIYSDTLNQIVENFSSSLGGAMGDLSKLQTAMERKKTIDDLYVDDYDKIYQLSKLTRDINKSIDETDNLKSKKALKALLEEINKQQAEGVKLSQYDLDNMRREYELALAKEKLLEAQNTKIQVRMTRDAEGNYGYVYTADASKVEEAEQNYEDKLYAMQKANTEYIDELQSNIVKAQQDCMAALSELRAEDFASQEEYEAAVQQIYDHYNTLIDGYFEQMDHGLNNNKKLYEVDWQEYSQATGYKISKDEDFVDKFNETTYAELSGFVSREEAEDTWKKAVETATTDASNAYDSYNSNMQNALEDGETNMENFQDKVNEVVQNTTTQAEEAENKAKEMADTYKTGFSDISSALSAFIDTWNKHIKDLIALNTNLAKSFDAVVNAAKNLDDIQPNDVDLESKLSKESAPPDAAAQNDPTKGNNSQSSSPVVSSTGQQESTPHAEYGGATWSRGMEAYEHINRGHWGVGLNNRIAEGKKDGYTEGEVTLGQRIIDYTYPVSEKGLGYPLDKAKKLLGYNTGGYTGKWNSSEGKLALLHEKELVLNADDTKNFLSAVDIVRKIADMIDLNAASASGNLSSAFRAETGVVKSADEIQQQVYITAEFKDATTANEITSAFDNLINRASQFANRKK